MKKNKIVKDNKELICCDNIVLKEIKEKYPAGLPLTSIFITYCDSCKTIHNVYW